MDSMILRISALINFLRNIFKMHQNYDDLGREEAEIIDFPLGIRLNNPLNIRLSKNEWLGAKDEIVHPEFESFETPIYGLRAGFVLIGRTYYIRYNLDTVASIMNRFAPPSENPTDKYIEFVCDEIGVERHEILDLGDMDLMLDLVKAMVMFEQGLCRIKTRPKAWFIEEDYMDAWEMAFS